MTARWTRLPRGKSRATATWSMRIIHFIPPLVCHEPLKIVSLFQSAFWRAHAYAHNMLFYLLSRVIQKWSESLLFISSGSKIVPSRVVAHHHIPKAVSSFRTTAKYLLRNEPVTKSISPPIFLTGRKSVPLWPEIWKALLGPAITSGETNSLCSRMYYIEWNHPIYFAITPTFCNWANETRNKNKRELESFCWLRPAYAGVKKELLSFFLLF